MKEGVNMGRQCPWTKEEVVNMYNAVNDYAKMVGTRTLIEEGIKSAAESMAAFNMFKFPIVYIFIHYHFGQFEDLNLSKGDITTYITILPMIKEFANGILEGLEGQIVFGNDATGEIAPTLSKMCKEVLYIEENF